MHVRVPSALLLVLTLAACGGTDTGEAPTSQETPDATVAAQALAEAPLPFQLSEEQTRGKSVYETMCWSCHGTAGRGDGPAVVAGTVAPPRDLTATTLTDAAIRRIQADFQAQATSPQADQPHMQNVLSIVDAEAFAAALAYIPALTYPPEIPGSAIAGHGTYILRCQGCHGATGMGDGPGADILEIRPANFTQDTLLAARNFEAAFQKIRTGGEIHGSSMPAWGVMLSDGDVWDLVSYISSFQGGVLSPPPSG